MMRWLWLLGFVASAASAQVSVRDDAGNTVVLPRPAQRVVALAPHVTELLFAAGGAERIVGAVSHSDYPPAARNLPLAGSSSQIDIERLLAMKPDLLVVWLHSSAERQMDQLRRLGIPLFYSNPRTLGEVPDSILRLGKLMGTEQHARETAAPLQRRIDALSAQNSKKRPVRVFYQVWSSPLYTLNADHVVSDAIRVCGGVNVFGGLSAPAPVVSIEAVLLEDPEAIVAGRQRGEEGNSLSPWMRYSSLQAVRKNNLFALDADLMHRPGPRIVDGAEALCAHLDEARGRRGAKR